MAEASQDEYRAHLATYTAFYLAVVVTTLLVAILRVASVHFGWTTPFSPVQDRDSPGISKQIG